MFIWILRFGNLSHCQDTCLQDLTQATDQVFFNPTLVLRDYILKNLTIEVAKHKFKFVSCSIKKNDQTSKQIEPLSLLLFPILFKGTVSSPEQSARSHPHRSTHTSRFITFCYIIACACGSPPFSMTVSCRFAFWVDLSARAYVCSYVKMIYLRIYSVFIALFKPMFSLISWVLHRQYICRTCTWAHNLSFGSPMIRASQTSSEGSVPVCGSEVVFLKLRFDERSTSSNFSILCWRIFDLKKQLAFFLFFFTTNLLKIALHQTIFTILDTIHWAYYLKNTEILLIKLSVLKSELIRYIAATFVPVKLNNFVSCCCRWSSAWYLIFVCLIASNKCYVKFLPIFSKSLEPTHYSYSLKVRCFQRTWRSTYSELAVWSSKNKRLIVYAWLVLPGRLLYFHVEKSDETVKN